MSWLHLYLIHTLHGIGAGTKTGTMNDGFLYYAMYCTHYTATGTEPIVPVPVSVPCSVYEPLDLPSGRSRVSHTVGTNP